MSIITIAQSGNPILHKKSEKVDLFTDEIQKTVQDLMDTMYAWNLIGIAAPQIGVDQQIFISEIRETPSRKSWEISPLTIYINPEIIWKSESLSGIYEGCGSVQNSGLFAIVHRPDQIRVRAQDVWGTFFELSASGLLSHVIQHEIDHLNWILFIEHVNPEAIITDTEYRALMQK
jgi:peptide deformylase